MYIYIYNLTTFCRASQPVDKWVGEPAIGAIPVLANLAVSPPQTVHMLTW